MEAPPVSSSSTRQAKSPAPGSNFAKRPGMELAQNTSQWLRWLGRVRFLVISFLLAVVLAVHQLTSLPLTAKYFVPEILLWYFFATCYLILLRWIPTARWHAPLQITGDLILITGLLYSTGGIESYFIWLYWLVIWVASVMFERRGVFIVAGGAFVLLGMVVEFTEYGWFPRT